MNELIRVYYTESQLLVTENKRLVAKKECLMAKNQLLSTEKKVLVAYNERLETEHKRLMTEQQRLQADVSCLRTELTDLEAKLNCYREKAATNDAAIAYADQVVHSSAASCTVVTVCHQPHETNRLEESRPAIAAHSQMFSFN